MKYNFEKTELVSIISTIQIEKKSVLSSPDYFDSQLPDWVVNSDKIIICLSKSGKTTNIPKKIVEMLYQLSELKNVAPEFYDFIEQDVGLD